jgi:hypothetical protein
MIFCVQRNKESLGGLLTGNGFYPWFGVEYSFYIWIESGRKIKMCAYF